MDRWSLMGEFFSLVIMAIIFSALPLKICNFSGKTEAGSFFSMVLNLPDKFFFYYSMGQKEKLWKTVIEFTNRKTTLHCFFTVI